VHTWFSSSILISLCLLTALEEVETCSTCDSKYRYDWRSLHLFYVQIKNVIKFSISLNFHHSIVFLQVWFVCTRMEKQRNGESNWKMWSFTSECQQTHNARNHILFYEEISKSCLTQIKPVRVHCSKKFLSYIAVLPFWVVRLSSSFQMTLVDLIPNLT